MFLAGRYCARGDGNRHGRSVIVVQQHARQRRLPAPEGEDSTNSRPLRFNRGGSICRYSGKLYCRTIRAIGREGRLGVKMLVAHVFLSGLASKIMLIDSLGQNPGYPKS